MSTVIDVRALIAAIERGKPEERTVAYEFSNGRKFYHEPNPYPAVETGFPYTFPFELE